MLNNNNNIYLPEELEEEYLAAVTEVISTICDKDLEISRLANDNIVYYEVGKRLSKQARVEAIFKRKIELMRSFVNARTS